MRHWLLPLAALLIVPCAAPSPARAATAAELLKQMGDKKPAPPPMSFSIPNLPGGGPDSEAGIARLEARLAADPENVAIRASLLEALMMPALSSPEKARQRDKHLLWMIEHHPEAEVLGSPEGHMEPTSDAETWKRAKELWTVHGDRATTDAAVISHAASFFSNSGDESRTEDLLKKAQKLDPANPDWHEDLARAYDRASFGPGADDADRDLSVKKLAEMEQALAKTARRSKKAYMLDDLAEYSYDAGEDEKAKKYALENLEANNDAQDWNYGNAINKANIILGRLALKQGDKTAAKDYLARAGRTPGSPQLNSFGPNMTLAKELLAAGEKDAVLAYFDACAKFWKMGGKDLKTWTEDVKAGRTPDFGGNLRY